MTVRSRALVTGANGFIGSHLVRKLVGEDVEVHAILRPASSAGALSDVADRLTIHRFGGGMDALFRIVEKAEPAIVYHLGTYFRAEHAPGDIGPMVAANLQFPAELVEAMLRAGCRRLVNAGTAWQHFGDRPYSPVCFHAATKQAFEALLAYFVEVRGLRTITLKLHDTYGPRDERKKLFFLLDRAAKEGKPLEMSPGEQTLDLTYISDVVEAFRLAGRRLLEDKNESPGESYVVQSGRRTKLRDAVALYSRVTGKAVPIAWGGRPYRAREVMTPWTKGLTLPGWTPKVDLEEGIKRMERGEIS